ncbi:hypothetical protein STRIP9103_03327 [Streptomyces ipomoeae 91-03]|uniref:Uncharacterized protein n=1 Tax=Streptomyces ipomoeae 91-03 TaxID=698759 RepID=L1L0D1_9ACTN|nr:hypothetical protein STRIP9103_03327 [Streptomyces ipomoeae 91-03]
MPPFTGGPLEHAGDAQPPAPAAITRWPSHPGRQHASHAGGSPSARRSRPGDRRPVYALHKDTNTPTRQ